MNSWNRDWVVMCTHTVISEGQYRCDWSFLCFALCLQYWQETEEVCQDKHDECLHLTHLQTTKVQSVVIGFPPVIWRSGAPPLLKLLFKPIMLKYWWFCLLKDYLCRFSPPIDTYTNMAKIFTVSPKIQLNNKYDIDKVRYREAGTGRVKLPWSTFSCADCILPQDLKKVIV